MNARNLDSGNLDQGQNQFNNKKGKDKKMEKIIWHYTNELSFPRILNHGFLLPSPEPDGKKNVLWFSAEDYWENSINGSTVTDYASDPFNRDLLTKKEQALLSKGEVVTKTRKFSPAEVRTLFDNMQRWTTEETIVKAGGARFGINLEKKVEGRTKIYHWDELWKKTGFSYKFKCALETSAPNCPVDSSKWYGGFKPIRLDLVDYIHVLKDGEWEDFHWDVRKIIFINMVNNTINGVGKGSFDPYPSEFKKEWLKKMTPDMIADCYGPVG